MPDIICWFQKDFPNIDFEVLMGDYPEIEQWVLQGRDNIHVFAHSGVVPQVRFSPPDDYAMRTGNALTPMTKCFLAYLPYRDPDALFAK